MYADTNFKSKKAFKEAVAAGERIRLYQPGPFGDSGGTRVSVEGPWYPEPHRWYATVTRDAEGFVTSVK